MSIKIEVDGKEVEVATVWDGARHSREEAIARYIKAVEAYLKAGKKGGK